MEFKKEDISDPAINRSMPSNQVAVRYWELGEYAWLQERLIDFLDSVLNASQIPFHVRRQGRRKIAVRTPIDVPKKKNLAGFIYDCQSFMDFYDPDLFYSADFRLFFDCYLEHPFSEVMLCAEPEAAFNSDLIVAEVYNDFILHLRRQAVARKVRKRLADWKAGLKYQARSASERLAGWSAEHKLLLPVRVDLYCVESALVGEDLLPRMTWCKRSDGRWARVPLRLPHHTGVSETRARIDPVAAFSDRTDFFDNQYGADRDLFEHLVAYMSKMECGGKSRALHQHCLFLFDGTKEKDVDKLVMRIEERWRKVTRGLGLTYNCHRGGAREDMIKNGVWALDPLHRGDARQLAKLQRYVAYYFAKDDGQMLHVKPKSGANALVMARR